jgi:hypothetical protein
MSDIEINNLVRNSISSERKPLNTDDMDSNLKETYNSRMRVTIGIKDKQ